MVYFRCLSRAILLSVVLSLSTPVLCSHDRGASASRSSLSFLEKVGLIGVAGLVGKVLYNKLSGRNQDFGWVSKIAALGVGAIGVVSIVARLFKKKGAQERELEKYQSPVEEGEKERLSDQSSDEEEADQSLLEAPRRPWRELAQRKFVQNRKTFRLKKVKLLGPDVDESKRLYAYLNNFFYMCRDPKTGIYIFSDDMSAEIATDIIRRIRKIEISVRSMVDKFGGHDLSFLHEGVKLDRKCLELIITNDLRYGANKKFKICSHPECSMVVVDSDEWMSHTHLDSLQEEAPDITEDRRAQMQSMMGEIQKTKDEIARLNKPIDAFCDSVKQQGSRENLFSERLKLEIEYVVNRAYQIYIEANDQRTTVDELMLVSSELLESAFRLVKKLTYFCNLFHYYWEDYLFVKLFRHRNEEKRNDRFEFRKYKFIQRESYERTFNPNTHSFVRMKYNEYIENYYDGPWCEEEAVEVEEEGEE